MRVCQKAATVVAISLVVCICAAGVRAQNNTEEREARGFVEALAQSTYKLAWPTATYKSWALRGVERATGGLNIRVRLSGLSAFDNGDLWLDLMFQMRNGALADLFVERHNAILAEPFSTSKEIVKILKGVADDYARQSAARAAATAAPPASGLVEGACLTNPTTIPIRFSYRWGTGEWTNVDLPSNREQWFSYPIVSGAASPKLEIRFDNSLAEGYTAREYALPSSQTRLPIRCTDVTRYDFRLNQNVIDLFVATTQTKTYMIGVTVVEAGTYVYGGQSYTAGVRVDSVVTPSPAASAGLAAGDILFKVNGTTATNVQTFRELVAGSRGASLTIDFVRGSSLLRVAVVPVIQ